MVDNNGNIILRRGLYWPGIRLECWADQARTVPSDLTGWSAYLDAALAAGKAPAFSVPCQVSEDDAGVVIIGPMSEADTLAIKAGKYVTDLGFRNADGHTVGPFFKAEIIVEDVVTRPPAA